MSLERYYQSIRPYVPATASAILDKQIPEIRREVRESVDSFGEQLGRFLRQQIEAEQKRHEQSLGQLRSSLDELRGQLAEGAPDPAQIDALRKQLDDFEARWRGVGETLQGVALAAVRQTGLPIDAVSKYLA
ncbi:MAG: hypothetical protein DRQ55_13430 [Planctomycetota bacterium]|nr:MAG: hypothetical protein DRQ55_13430 [Planctomycetota bacterium]